MMGMGSHVESMPTFQAAGMGKIIPVVVNRMAASPGLTSFLTNASTADVQRVPSGETWRVRRRVCKDIC